jgi:predicted metal-dependent phosphoesterase TrpH
MAGAEFVRADLHIHTYQDTDASPSPELKAYIDAAVAADVRVLAITDHNTTRFTRTAMTAAEGFRLIVLPGIEISTHDGHLLAIFAPEAITELDAFANPSNLKLRTVSETEQRSVRSMLELVDEIHQRGGLAIPAHVDAQDGIHSLLKPAELAELLASRALAGLEFRDRQALSTWFTDTDSDPHRHAAWKARQADPELRQRGLARLQSSDAHTPETVGQDRARRTLTRLRLDDLNFTAVRNAIAFNPKARCKAEAILPITYPRVLSGEFTGGFLDGVTMEFAPNLNCLIGGRGSGKSTALLAIRAALGAALGPDEDPDDPVRMPEETVVRFIDNTGSERTAVRRRGERPVDAGSHSPIRLRLADLGQDESGRLARGYEGNPDILLEFLDGFVVRHEHDEREQDLLGQLEDNASEVRRTSVRRDQIHKLEEEEARLDASLKAAEKGKVEQIAEWARELAAQGPFIQHLDTALRGAIEADEIAQPIDLDRLAADFGVDLTSKRAPLFVDGERGLREGLVALERERAAIRRHATNTLKAAGRIAEEALERWKQDQENLEDRLSRRQAELEAEGLKVQAGAVREIANRMNAVRQQLVELRTKQAAHRAVRDERRKLLGDLHANREALFERRRATLRRIARQANSYSDGLEIHVSYEQGRLNDAWVSWLLSTFSFRRPRVQRLADKLTPSEFADRLLSDRASLLQLREDSGEPFFSEGLAGLTVTWPMIFELQTMRLEDRPRIQTREVGATEPKQFDRLSEGQQRSVLLSLLLCAERAEPLVLDQPEDHLDAQYIASAVVRHLEAAKERRQVILATHSPNLTVLGDAELIIPLHVEDGGGRPYDIGAVDRPETRDRVCELLEGGVEAYRKRGERYGLRFLD